MLAVAFGQHGLNLGTLPKADGSPYADTAFRNHPCTMWVRSDFASLAWLIVHANELCAQYTLRYGKVHGCEAAIKRAAVLFSQTGLGLGCYSFHSPFARAMPDDLKHDKTIDTITAYRRYLVAHKPWAKWTAPAYQPSWWK